MSIEAAGKSEHFTISMKNPAQDLVEGINRYLYKWYNKLGAFDVLVVHASNKIMHMRLLFVTYEIAEVLANMGIVKEFGNCISWGQRSKLFYPHQSDHCPHLNHGFCMIKLRNYVGSNPIDQIKDALENSVVEVNIKTVSF